MPNFDTGALWGQLVGMVAASSDSGDSFVNDGGAVPGAAGCPAFRLERPEPSPIPIVIAVPHAGRVYPAQLARRMRDPGPTALRLEDRHVDRLGVAVARETGAALLIAQAPRAMIDLNRAVDEMDWEMVVGGHPAWRKPGQTGRRVRSGLGLVPRRLPGLGEIWNRRMDAGELDERIDSIHRPYHEALAGCLRGLRDRWGAALLIDLHSMPPLARRGSGESVAQFVIGDRFGSSCDGALCAAAFDEFSRLRRPAAHNRPYAGGYVLDRHAAPAQGVHAMQIEICRSTYLDALLTDIGPGFEKTVAVLVRLVRRLAAETAALDRSGQLPLAAE